MLADKLVFLTTKLFYIWQNIAGFFLVWLGLNLVLGFLIFFLFRKRKKRKPSLLKIITFNICLLILLLNTFFFLGEIYYRFIFDLSGSLGNLKTSKRWMERHVTTNLDYFRDRDFSTRKEAGVTRIGVLGDSFAFGWGVDVDQRFSNILEKKLNRPEGQPLYEVYNIAKPGWESKNELDFLQKEAGMFNFDIIVLSYFLNDIYHDRALNIDFVNPQITTLTTNPVLKWLIDRSFFLEFMTARLKNYFGRSIEDATQREMVIYRDPPSWENHRETLQKIVDLCRERRQKLLVVIFPFLNLVNQNPYPAAFIHEKVAGFFRENGVETLDLYPALKDYSSKELRASPYDYHPSPFVHQIVSGLLYEKLAQ